MSRAPSTFLNDYEGTGSGCFTPSTGPDFVLVVWVADMPAYQALVQRLFTQDANVRNVKAFFCTRRPRPS